MTEQTLAAPIDEQQELQRGFSRYQSLLVALLAFVQFTIILDFIIMSPLGAILMPALDITPRSSAWRFRPTRSAPAFPASWRPALPIASTASGCCCSSMSASRSARLLCALAPNYHLLLLGRIVTGLFGGVIGSVVLAIITDLFPLHLRGRVMGFVQTAFAASQVLGIPVGLFLANHWNWHVAFGAIVGLSIAAIGVAVLLADAAGERPSAAASRTATPFAHLIATVSEPRYTLAFAVTTLLATGGYMLMPFGSAYTVHNLGIDIVHLPTIYLVSGLFSIFIGPAGRPRQRRIRQISDLHVRQRHVDRHGADLHPSRPGRRLTVAIIVNVLMFVGIFSRMIPSQALISAIPAAHNAARSAPSAPRCSNSPAGSARCLPRRSSRKMPTARSGISTGSDTSWSAPR